MRFVAKAIILSLLLLGGYAHAQERAGSGVRVTCYTAYDAEYFYLAAVVRKLNVQATARAPFSDPLSADSVAVFLQRENEPTGVRRTPRSVEMAVSAAGGSQLYRGVAAAPLKGFADLLATSDGIKVPFKAAASMSVGTASGGDSGYTVEMAVPWIEIGGVPAVGEKMRFNVSAFSAGAAAPLSLSPSVKSGADVQNPSLWNEIVFVDAPVRSVAAAPNAKVSARLFNVKPLIDGVITEGEWNTLTAFAFSEFASGGSVALAPALAAARVRPKVVLKKSRPPIVPRSEDLSEPPPRTSQTVPKLVLALYQYEFQNDPRKSAPLHSTRSPEGVSLLPAHPLEGPGPWFTYDRVDWHRTQLADVRRAGIDAILPVYRADVAAKQQYAVRGLQTLVAALRHLERIGQDYPLIALYLDTSSLSDAHGEKPDLSRPEAKAQLYAAIKDFYLEIPAPYRLAISLSAANGGAANVVTLSSGAAFANIDGGIVAYCRRRFLRDFGRDLVILGASDFKGKAPLDGFVNNTHGSGFQMEDGGWIKPASVGAGHDETMHGPDAPLRPRADGRAYRTDWKQAIARRADWVFIDGWNDFQDAAQIAPSLQDGVEYVDSTRAYTREFLGVTPIGAALIGHTLPRTVAPHAAFAATLRLKNTGMVAWTPEATSVRLQWRGGASSGTAQPVTLSSPVLPDQNTTLAVDVTTPAQPGDYTLEVEVAPGSRRTEGGASVSVAVRVASSGSGLAITAISCDLPKTVESAGTYAAHVVLRNDGKSPWKRDGGRIVARVWRYVSPINATGEAESHEPVDMADAGADLPGDVAPGQTVSLTVPITFSTADDSPLPPWSQADNWIYEIRWEYSASPSGSTGAVSEPEVIAITDTDLGAQFISDQTPRSLPADRRVPVKLSVRNNGPQTWVKEVTRVGYHWYYLDGTEAVWQDETTPIPQNVEPGGEVNDLLAWITAPPNDGVYFLVWDLKVGDAWASTQPSIRANETRIDQVQVVKGKLRFPDLSKAYNVDGIAGVSNRADGDLDGAGHTLPAELVPPYTNARLAPSTIWLPVRGSGYDSSRRISFAWGSKTDKDKNLIQCQGQKVPLSEPRKGEEVSAMHILAASTKGSPLASFTLIFDDGSQQLATIPISRWDAPPTHGEEVAFLCRYTWSKSSDKPDKPAALYRYTVKIPEKRKLVAVELPNRPEVKIAAITLEK